MDDKNPNRSYLHFGYEYVLCTNRISLPGKMFLLIRTCGLKYEEGCRVAEYVVGDSAFVPVGPRNQTLGLAVLIRLCLCLR